MCLKFWVLNEIESPFILIYECFMSESIMCINICMILYGIYENFTENLNRTIRKQIEGQTIYDQMKKGKKTNSTEN